MNGIRPSCCEWRVMVRELRIVLLVQSGSFGQTISHQNSSFIALSNNRHGTIVFAQFEMSSLCCVG